MNDRIKLFDIYIDNLTFVEAVKALSNFLKTTKFHHVITLNAARAYNMSKDRELMHIYKKAALVVADGVSIAWYAKLLGRPVKQRVTGADLFSHILNLAAERRYRVFILKGGKNDISRKIKERILKDFPELQFAGTYCPPYDFNIDRDEQENRRILESIQDVPIDILVVSLSSPKGEKWIWRNREYLKGISVCVEVGAGVDFAIDRIKRAPLWMRRWGLEWLFRLCCEPRRLWKRNLLSSVFFIRSLAKELFKVEGISADGFRKGQW